MNYERLAILLIEDNPGDARLIREMLAEDTRNVHTFEWAQCLKLGLERVAQGNLDLILLDLGLPESTGLETLRQLRASGAALPAVVVMSGLEDEAIAAQAVQEGAQDYLIKGQVDGRLLCRSICYAVERNAAAVVLRSMHDELEKRVIERTAQLGSTNERLMREIEERKRAEKEMQELQSQLLQAQKMESVGRLAGGVAHDFNNTLSVILGCTELLLQEMAPFQPFYAELIEIRKAGNRAADLVRQLLAFARKQTVSPKILELNTTVGSMLSMIRRIIGEDIALNWVPGENLWPIKIDPSQVDQILANLCVNARDAIAGIGTVTIETTNVYFDDAHCFEHPGHNFGEYVQLSVSDDGSGMTKEILDSIFDPFFTTKAVGDGTGLGLSTVYGIVKQNEGFIDVHSEVNKGTSFRIYLPRYSGAGKSVSVEGQSPELQGGRETILLVEDALPLLSLFRKMLERLGYQVLTAATPGEAIELAENHLGQIDLLMTDVVMPEMNGRDLCKRLLSFYPNLKKLFMSGYTANVIAHHGVLEEGVCFIQKPFSQNDLSNKLYEALHKQT